MLDSFCLNDFRKNFEAGRERDAQLCVYVEGRRVVDLWVII